MVLGGDLAYGTFGRPSFGAGRRERVKPGTSTYVPPKWSTGPKYSVRATCRSWVLAVWHSGTLRSRRESETLNAQGIDP